MSYDRIGNTKIRDNGHKKSIFDKVGEIKQGIKAILPELEGEALTFDFFDYETAWRSFRAMATFVRDQLT